MESSTLFTIANAFGLKAGCMASVIVNRSNNETPDDTVLKKAEEDLADVLVHALDDLLKKI